MSISDSRPFPFYLGPASTSSSKDETIANVNFSADGTLSMPELHAAVGLESPAYIAQGTPRVSTIPDHANTSESRLNNRNGSISIASSDFLRFVYYHN